MNRNGKIAQLYASKGMAVYPVQPRGKAALLPGGFNNATLDPDEIENIWDHDPDANIGIATGSISHLFALDVDLDKDKGKDGFRSIREWEQEHGTFPTTVMDITGRGGSHLLFAYDGKDIPSTVDLYNGVDIRGEGGGIVVPPSEHENGRRYEWEVSPDDMPIAQADDNVLSFIRNGLKLKKKELPFMANTDPPAVVPEGKRNDYLFKLSCSLQAKGLSDDAILQAIITENKSKCNPPLTEKEIITLIKSAMKYDKGIFVPSSLVCRKTAQTTNEPITKPLTDFTEQDPKWLIEPYLPKGKITLFAGDGGSGKTYVWVSLLAAISRGETAGFWSDSTRSHTENNRVMYFSSEDDTESTLMRRLRLAGAVSSNIRTIGLDDPRLSDIKFGSKQLESEIANFRPAVCVFDPLQSFISAKIRMSERNAMRQALEPLNYMGAKYGTTFIIIVHTNKRGDTYGRTRIADSSDLWDQARSVFIVGSTPADDTLKYCSHEKCNYHVPNTTILFRIDDDVMVPTGTTTKRDKDFILDSKKDRKTIKKEQARETILNILSTQGTCLVGELDVAARAAGISENALRNAKKELKQEGEIIFHPETEGQGKGVKWLVSLPD